MNFNTDYLVYSLPMLVLLITGLGLMLLDAFNKKSALPAVTALGILISMGLAIPGLVIPQENVLIYNGMITAGGLSGLIHIFLSFSALLSIFFIDEFFKKNNVYHGDIFAILVFALIGMIMMSTANDLIIVFIGLEIMSICLYIMAGSYKHDPKSNESALKYFLLGAFTTGFLLYGMTLIYGMTGTTQLSKMATLDMPGIRDKFSALFYPGLGLLLIGFLFKVAAFPFHNWTPDVYQGAPTPMAGFMATGSKMAAFITLGNIMFRLIPADSEKIITILAMLALISMWYGNIVAAQQTNLKRMLAYSSISHTGYLLLGICGGPEGYKAVTFYMLTYTFMTIGAFGLISVLESKHEDAELANYRGLGIKYPLLGILMSVLMFSMAGFPPFAGFIGKYLVFLSAIKAKLTWYAALGILSSVVGAWYYLRVIVTMYFVKPEGNEEPLAFPAGLNPTILSAIAIVVLLFVLGVYPAPIATYLDVLSGAARSATASL